MNKAYNPINWVNNETPINETNLNKMSNGLSAVDDRVIALNKTLGSYSDKINEALEASVVAQDAKEIALESAEKAEEALKNAEAVVGVGIATKDKAGLVKADDVHIASDGTLKFIEKTTSTTMPNSHKGRLMFEEIGGMSEQRTTTGAQLLNLNGVVLNKEDAGVTVESLGDGTYIYKGTATNSSINVWLLGGYNNGGVVLELEPGTYFIQGVNLYKTSSGSIGSIIDDGGGRSFTLTETTQYCGVRAKHAVVGQTYNELVKPILAKGGTRIPWEPYTGGIPSPNPEYPQEIKKSVVGEITTRGAQLFDASSLFAQSSGTSKPTITVNGSTVIVAGAAPYAQAVYNVKNPLSLAGQTLTLSQKSLSNTNSSVKATMQIRILRSDGTMTYYSLNSNSSLSFEVPEDVTNIQVRLVCNNTSNELETENVMTIEGIMLNIGEALPWEEYRESSITLSSPIELCGIGDVQDVIDVENGVVRKKIKKAVFDGSDDEGWSTSNSLSGRYIVVKNDAKKYGNILCTHAKNVNNSNNVNECCVNSSKYFYVNTSFATLAEWKAHLASKPMEVVYELAEEVIEELSIADQIALNSLLTYDGITYLEFDSEIEPTFKGEYGTSKVGGYTLEGLLTGRNAELLQQSNADRITALETALINNV